MDTAIVVTSLLSSSVAVAIVTCIKELIIWILNRRAKLSDEEKAREDEENDFGEKLKKRLDEQRRDINELLDTMSKFQETLESYLKSEKTLLRDKIKYLVFKYIEFGEITLDEKNAIKHMWHIYHYEWGGNGDLDEVMLLLETIPMKIPRIHQED